MKTAARTVAGMGGSPWEVLAAPRREPGWVRIRRAAAVAAIGVLLVAGTVSIAGQIRSWVARPPDVAARVAASDAELVGVAVPFAVDYLSWAASDEGGREARQAALTRSAAEATSVDGWDGTGRQWADSPTAIGITRGSGTRGSGTGGSTGDGSDGGDGRGDTSGGDRAVVTVRVRVIPFTPTNGTRQDADPQAGNDPDTETGGTATDENGNAPNGAGDADATGTSTPQPVPESPPERPTGPPDAPGEPSRGSSGGPSPGVPNVASGAVPDTPGWAAGAPRWLNLAVPVARRGARVVVTAPPALVGSPQPMAARPAVPRASTAEDAGFARATRGAITTLLRAYGTGELQYARVAGTAFTGLDRAAVLAEVTAWRVHAPTTSTGSDSTGSDGTGSAAGPDGTVRVGDVSVTWALSGGAGTLRCAYRVELRADGGRWYLASIGVATEAVT